MALIKLLVAPIQRVVNFPLVQLTVAIAVILLLQAADSRSVFGEAFSALDLLVDFTVRQVAAIFEVKSFTRAWLITGFMIAYVYLAGWLLVLLAKAVIRAVVEHVARNNTFGLRNTVARERGIEAYRAWLPLERIRPAHIAQPEWEQRFAWPAGDKPPYPPLTHRVVRAVVTYVATVLIVAALLEVFTPFPALTWLGRTARMLTVGS
jgi:hypothetical protein